MATKGLATEIMYIFVSVARNPPTSRTHGRIPLNGWADYRQGELYGSWVLLDVSAGGFCACGDLGALDLEKPLDVELRNDERTLETRLLIAWRRYEPTGVSVHGWTFLHEVPDILDFMASLTRGAHSG